MEKSIPIHLHEIIFSSSVPQISRQLSQLENNGKIRKIAPRIFTPIFDEPIETIIKRNLYQIIGHLYPGAVLSHRSAFEFAPTKGGHIFITYQYTKKIVLPGVILRLLAGPGSIEGDKPISGELFASQKARAFLENLQQFKYTGATSKCLSLPELEEKLEQIIRVHGEKELNNVRDEARAIAAKLNMEKEFEKLNMMISALLTTHTSKVLHSPLAKARAIGTPYDPGRIALFEKLFHELRKQEFKKRPDKNLSLRSFKNFAFYESYFSNYIEGTVFGVEEAKQIIATNQPMANRNEDSHDVLGTYHLASNKTEMVITPGNPDQLLNILMYRHKILLSAREEKKPGKFKDKNNFAGHTAFVDFALVKGTLIRGFEYYQGLENPFSKAVYIMFLISEVHPFLDGNGRIARIMLNAELVKHGQSKIMIPTVFRDDYMGALRKLTRQEEPGPYIRMLQRAHEFSETIHSENMDEMQEKLTTSNAFLEHTEGQLRIID